ncbi:MAG: polysaccharide deacetylase family protein [Terriglobia bacterium]
MELRAKPLKIVFTVMIFVLTSCGLAHAQTKTVAERLGYPSDAKLLILHADDLGLAHSVDAASFAALERKAASSASVMVPCPWFTEVAAYAREHPDHDIGLHLTHTSEWKMYRWGPVASKDQVPGLLDPSGYLWPDVPDVAKNAKPEEIEREIRAQVELAIRSGLKPTHLDTHMGTVFAKPEFFAAYLKVAHEYGIPAFVPRVAGASPQLLEMLRDTDFVVDGFAMASEGVKPEGWKAFYAGVVRTLKPGLTEVIVHLAYDDAESQAIMVDHPDFGAAWRQRDFDVITSSEFKKLLEENKVILLGWKDLKKLL